MTPYLLAAAFVALAIFFIVRWKRGSNEPSEPTNPFGEDATGPLDAPPEYDVWLLDLKACLGTMPLRLLREIDFYRWTGPTDDLGRFKMGGKDVYGWAQGTSILLAPRAVVSEAYVKHELGHVCFDLHHDDPDEMHALTLCTGPLRVLPEVDG